jgi:hypothetical protein
LWTRSSTGRGSPGSTRVGKFHIAMDSKVDHY